MGGPASPSGEPSGRTDRGFVRALSSWSGLAVIDLNDPVAPALLGRMETPGYAAGLALQGDRVYVADWSGLSLISITDPARPFLINQLPLPGQAQGVAVAGSWAYVAVGDQGLQVIDLVAFAPAEQFDSAGTGRRVSLASTELLLADHSGGVLVLSREAAMRAVYLPLVQVSRP